MTVRPTLEQSGGEQRRSREDSLERLRPPAAVAGFEPERCLGAGAFGQVWVARDSNTGRRVAIKFYSHRGGLDWALLSREVEKLAFLFGDRYVVQLLAVGWDAEPPFFVMEYMENGSLEDLLAAGPLPVEVAVRIFRDVAVGLVHAHGKGVLHCDLKPANVLLDSEGKPRLADFGQSRLSSDQSPALGTLFYMAPEQADLEGAPDSQWDVYALGALLYRMLTGRAPYSNEPGAAEIDRPTKLEDRLQQYRELLWTSPRRTAHRKVRGVDRSLAEILERCLAPNPKKRLPNPQAVVDALDARAERHARRPLLVLGALGPVLLLAVMGLFAWWAFSAAVSRTDDVVTHRTLESNRFAARFVAETVAQQIDGRWHALEEIAADPTFREDFFAAKDESTGPAHERLQKYLEQLLAEKELGATSWFAVADSGIQLARAPKGQGLTIGRDFAYRDYFHGQGRDLPPGTTGLKPIHDVHQSIVFRSVASGQMIVAFSVPIWGNGPRPATPGASPEQRPVAGVLAMTVELGRFAELRDDEQARRSAVLVDSRADADGKQGAVLEHPALAHLNGGATGPRGVTYLPAETVTNIEKLRSQRSAGQDLPGEEIDALALDAEFVDPLEPEAGESWLAAIEPVFVTSRGATPRDTGWAVIVQEPHSQAIAPVTALGRYLVWTGVIALGIVAAVITLLWGLVVLVLNDGSRAANVASFWRNAAATGSSRSESSASMSREARPVAPATVRHGGGGPEPARHAEPPSRAQR